MKLKLKKNFVFVLLGILIFAIVGVFIFKDNDNGVTDVLQKRGNPKVSIGVGEGYDGWTYGEWEITTLFESDRADTTILADGLAATTNSDVSTNANVSLVVSGQYLDNTSVEDFNAFDIKMTFPTYVFFSSFTDFVYVVDEANNALLLNDSTEVTGGAVSFGIDLPYCDFNNSDCSSLDSMFVWNLVDSNVVVTNLQPVNASSGSNFSFSVKINYDLTKYVIEPSQEQVVLSSVSFKESNDIALETLYTMLDNSSDVPLEFDDVRIDDIQVFNSWQSDWGIEPSGYDVYFKYGIEVDISHPELYSLDFTPSLEFGDVVSYSEDDLSYSEDLPQYYCAIEDSGERTVSCYFIVGVDLPLGISSMDTLFTVDVYSYNASTDVFETYEWNYTYEWTAELPEATYPTGTSTTHRQELDSLYSNIGAINKLNNNDSVEFDWIIESAASTVGETTSGVINAFNLWELTEEGTVDYTVELESNGGVIDDTYSGIGTQYTLGDSEYNIKSFYVEDDIEYDYVLDTASNQYYLESVSDYDTYGSKSVYIKINDGNYQLIGTYKKTASGVVYTASDSTTISNGNVTKNNPVTLPAGVTDIKVQYTGKRAAIYMGYYVKTELISSTGIVTKVNELIDQSKDVVLKNNSTLYVNSDNKGDKSVGTYLTSIESTTNVGSNSVINDKESDGSDSITYTSYAYEQVNFDSTNKDVAFDIINKQQSGIFYELLPQGATLDGSVIATIYGSDNNAVVNVTSTDNYQGSGRTLLKIEVSHTSDNVYESTNYYQSGFKITYDILYSALSNQSYGNVLNRDFAYYSNGLLSNGYKNAEEAPASLFSSTNAQNIMSNLGNSDDNSAVFKSTSTTVTTITVTVGDYNKETKGNLDTGYLATGSVTEGTKYSYRLQYVFSSDYEQIENLVFVDKLENVTGNISDFKGYLDSIDTSYLTNLGVNPVIYYSTLVDVDVENLDLTDTAVWSTTKPSDVRNIVAVAVSCGDYVFKGSDKVTPMIYINMLAPNAFSANRVVKTYNESYAKYNNVGNAKINTMTSDVTEVTIAKSNIKLDANTSVGQGTESVPAIVVGSYDYLIKVTNEDEIDYNNVSFEAYIPNGLVIESVGEVSNNGTSVEGVYSFDEDTRILTYDMSLLKANEVKDITINVSIDLDSIDNTSKFNASFELIKLANNEYNGTIVNTYNKLEVPELEFKKYVETNDTNGFTDQSTVLITKGETYTYRVNIKNISTIVGKNIKVVDKVPEGLSAANISNSGVYNSLDNTVTWTLSTLDGNSNVNLEYSVIVPDDITLGTIYRSSAHIEVVHPADDSRMLYDEETNIVSTLYQVASDIEVINKVSGLLADSTKLFTYNIEFTGDSTHVGNYDVLDKDNKVIGTLSINSEGIGSYNGTLKANEKFMFKLLPGGVNYKITVNTEEGYESTGTNAVLVGDKLEVSNITDEERLVNYTFTHSYDVSTSVEVGAKVTYDKEILTDMFSVNITDGNGYSDTKVVDLEGNALFDVINYDNVVGTYNYTVTQVNTGVSKVSYDTNTYKVVVIITNDGKGNLNKDVKYYNKLNEEVDEMVFNNTYLPNGLIIKNNNTSEYIDATKVFKYTIEINNSIDSAGVYKVKDKDNNELDDLVIDSEGNGIYSFELSNEGMITILDLPVTTNYVIKQEILPYYNVVVDGLSYSVDTDNNLISHTGSIVDETTQIIFVNNYATEGEFTPVSKVTLLEKNIEDKEFNFEIKDVSEYKSGYSEIVSNNELGEILFSPIKYVRPGTYTYEIKQVKGDSNHIYYDESKVTLTVVLEDNGDGTMSVVNSNYVYSNGKESFENKYSDEPIVVEPPVKDDSVQDNPNTDVSIGRFIIIVGMTLLVVVLIIVERKVRLRRYRLNS